eukprot:CAMPEP_0177654188 /NCGR_PEP_ID=MMETSP0447-20121125/14172_1 /TAXON_ID=0 /ORGANISM="Stygamoeba regulata, Strain BSH-02190019" /LENGTH=386 /DNA_ID=CAMNT_0019157767 /DNA_START=104 /DNA_END=1264 /DNA_ORIENTATION=+
MNTRNFFLLLISSIALSAEAESRVDTDAQQRETIAVHLPKHTRTREHGAAAQADAPSADLDEPSSLLRRLFPSLEGAGALREKWVLWVDTTVHRKVVGLSQGDYLQSLAKSRPFDSILSLAEKVGEHLQAMKEGRCGSLSLFREGVNPTWEDAAHAEGGQFVFQSPSADTCVKVWTTIISLVLLGQLSSVDDVTGMTLTYKKRTGKVTLWNRNARSWTGIKAVKGQLRREAGAQWVAYKPFVEGRPMRLPAAKPAHAPGGARARKPRSTGSGLGASPPAGTRPQRARGPSPADTTALPIPAVAAVRALYSAPPPMQPEEDVRVTEAVEAVEAVLCAGAADTPAPAVEEVACVKLASTSSSSSSSTLYWALAAAGSVGSAAVWYFLL